MNGTSPTGLISRVQQISPTQSILVTGIVSLLINIAVLIDYRHSPFSGFLLWDAANYWKWALDIAAGNWLGTTVFHQTPLYPYLLAAFITVFGEHLFPIYLFQCIIGAATSALVCSIASKTLNDQRAGLITGLLYALYGMQVFYTTKILSECPATFLLVLVVRLLLANNNLKALAAAGISMGLLLLAKPHFLMAVPLLVVFFFLPVRQTGIRTAVRQGACFIVPLALILLTVTARNYAVGKELVLISSNGGETFYIGNNARANGAYVPVEGISSDIAFQSADVVSKAREESGQELTRAEASRYWFKKGVTFAIRNPAKYISLELTKLMNTFSGAERSNMYSLHFERNNTTPWLALPCNGFYLLLPLFIAGVAATRRQWNVNFPVYTMLGVNLLNMLIFFYDTRFMVITMPFFTVLSGAGLWSIVRHVNAAQAIRKTLLQPRSIVVIGAIVLTLLIFLRDRSLPNQDWRQWLSLGEIHYGLGLVDKSIDYYIKASELNKHDCMPAFGVSKALFKRGNREEAARLYTSSFATSSPGDRMTILRDTDFDGLREYVSGVRFPQTSR